MMFAKIIIEDYMNKLLLGLVLCVISLNSWSGASSISGKMTNITSIEGALLIQIDDGKLPDNCSGQRHPWMRLDQQNSTMISVALAAWYSGNRGVTIYTQDKDNNVSYCNIKQLDPL